MSKKNLLNESTVRQFMKFANIERLADNFVNETYMAEEDPVEEGAGHYMEDEHGMSDMGDDMDAPDMDAPDMDADAAPGDELPPEAVDALEQAVEQGVEAMLAALAPFGVEGEASVEGGDELHPEPMDDMDDMGDVGDDEPVADGVEVVDEDEIVNETLKRVSRRLRGMKSQRARAAKRDALVESIATRIAKRLNTK